MKNEKELGRYAAKIIESSLRSTSAATFKKHYTKSSTEGKLKLSETTTTYDGKRYKSFDTTQMKYKFYLRSIKVKMDRHGFVQHYGSDGVRAGHLRKINNKNINVKPHVYKLPQKNWIDKAIDKTNILNVLGEEIAKIRGTEATLIIKSTLEKN